MFAAVMVAPQLRVRRCLWTSTLERSAARCSKPVVRVTRCLVSAFRSRRLSARLQESQVTVHGAGGAGGRRRRARRVPPTPACPASRPSHRVPPVPEWPRSHRTSSPSAGLQRNNPIMHAHPNPISPRTPAMVCFCRFPAPAPPITMHASPHASLAPHVLPMNTASQ